MPRLFAKAVFAGALALVPFAVPAAELVMVEQVGCAYCARWHKEIGPIYPKTPVSVSAPLRTVQLTSLDTADFEITRPVVFTPTFLLVDEGHELARLEGYAGEHFFWPLVEKMVADHTGLTPANAVSSGGS
ncbi:thioredoxin family protein [Donghicola sp. C2-DW-16]|uniref:Thioredoxin family protein n=1 Tax=Donghicola mangrovi TaxID=2729614 RepID=A0ABX2PEZ9_9RHOB|nr:thioredoxin family protein [Donghicola mangrovi]NVO27676.1 thioredoxin family protein [Donghicola mangrovi]